MNINIGDKITLKGVSKHGKNRLQQFGTTYWVSEIRDRVWTTKLMNTPGPFIMVFNVKGDHRWISLNDDPDFEIVEKLKIEKANYKRPQLEKI